MNFTFMPSLEHIAVVRTAIMLWNHEDNRVLLMKNYSTDDLQKTQRVWLDVEDKIIEKVPKLQLPKSLENKLLDIIKPIGLEMLKWSAFHENLLKSERKIVRKNLSMLCWTSQGIVDRKKTAEMLINDETFKVSNRYKLACIYCLKSYIPKLWNEMSELSQSYFHYGDPARIDQHDLVIYWTYYLKGELVKVKEMISRRNFTAYQVMNMYNILRNYDLHYTLNGYMFKKAAVTSKSATEYFFKKLTVIEKELLLVHTAEGAANQCICSIGIHSSISFIEHPYQCNREVVLFLLSQLNITLQKEILKCNDVQKCFLDWPWQSLVKLPILVSKFFQTDVLERLVDKVINGFRDYNYQKLFKEIWQKKVDESYQYTILNVFNLLLYKPLLLKLLIAYDKENFELIFNGATLLQREIFFCEAGVEICQSLVITDKWDSLKFFIQKCIPCRSKMLKFKKEFKKHIISSCTKKKLEEEKDMWNKFHKLVDHLTQKINKNRSKGEGNSIPAKRLCSVESCKRHSIKE